MSTTCRRKITLLVKIAYKHYFGSEIGNQDKSPHFCCLSCSIQLREWIKKKGPSMHFTIPMICGESKEHLEVFYFCMDPTPKWINFKKQNHIQYPNINSAMRPVPHSDVLPVLQPPVNYSLSVDKECMSSCSHEVKQKWITFSMTEIFKASYHNVSRIEWVLVWFGIK